MTFNIRQNMRSIPIALCSALLLACNDGLSTVEPSEWLPGGDHTNTFLLGANAFLRPADALTPEHDAEFYGGNSFFNDNWVQAPSSTANRDGLGPLFNARGCSGCHFRDGRAAPPEPGDDTFIGLLFRISQPSGEPDPVYGGQFQDVALPGIQAEVTPALSIDEETVELRDGTASLAHPSYTFTPHYGALDPSLQISPRIAPHMIGLGLLEAIPSSRLQALADPEDEDRDGISGRLQWRVDADTGDTLIGRFGWKGDAPTIRHQTAGAFNGDLGITSELFPNDDCSSSQSDCLTQPHGGEPELESHLLDRVTLYSRAVAVPVRRDWEDEDVLRGKFLFTKLGCVGCHTPKHTTGAFAPVPEFADQEIWPYTDLLLHDMGPDLADDRPLGEADGQEWKTPPLWGLGLVETVNGHTRFLHDGRARSFEEAVLWHGGEAQESRDSYADLRSEDREAVVRFLESL